MGVLDFLEYFDRPRNAVANAVYTGLFDSNQSAASGFWQGLTGNQDRSWGDVFGVEAGRPDDDWITWLAKNGFRLGTDYAGDPLNLMFGTGAISKGLGLANETRSAIARAGNALGNPLRKAGEAYQSGRVPLLGETPYQLLGGKLTGKYAPVEGIIAKNQRLGSMSDIEQEAMAALNAGKSSGLDPLELATQWERYGTDPKAARFIESMAPLGDRTRGLAENINEALQRYGIEGDQFRFLNEADQRYLPHQLTESGQRAAGGRIGDMRYSADISSPSREIMQWTDEAGRSLGIGKLSDARTGVRIEEATQGPRYFMGDTEVFPKQASLAEKATAFPETGFLTDPVASMYNAATGRQKTLNFLNTVGDLEQAGLVTREPIEGARQIRLSGWKDLYADPAVATRLENMGSGHFGLEGRNAIEDFMGKAANSQLGQWLTEANQVWKRNILPFPGWIAGNVGSNLVSLQQAGVNPMNLADAYKVIKGSADELLPGLSGQVFAKEMIDRGLTRQGLAGQALRDEFSQATRGPGRLQDLAERAAGTLEDAGYSGASRAVETAGSGVSRAADWWGKNYNERVLGFGSKVEDSFKLAAALDYVKRHPEFASMGANEKASLLDRAATFGKEALVNQSDITPFQRDLFRTLIPFGAWTTGIAKQTGSLALNNPSALANTERIMRSIFTPLSPQDKAQADDWIKESGPVQGGWLGSVMGMSPETSMMMTGRYLPQGALEQLKSRPLDFLLGSVTPNIKAPAELISGYNTFKNRPIDRVAGNFPWNVINPAIGQPYELQGGTKFGVELPASWAYMIDQSPAGRWANTLSDLGRQAGLWEDPYKGEGSIGEGLAYAGTGGKFMPYDATKYQTRRLNEQKRKISDLSGLLKYAMMKGDQKAVDLYQRELMYVMMNPSGGVHLEGS